MISFGTDGVRFNYRVAGVVISRGRVLLHRAEHDDFWALPGGRVELLEQAAVAVVREMREELAAELEVERLLWLVEGFFKLNDRRFHELGLYFLLKLPEESPLHDCAEPFYGIEADFGGAPLRLVFQWFDVETLKDARVYPLFLRTALSSLPETIQHVIEDEGD